MRSPQEVAKILAGLYGKKFSGKSKGRYKVSRKDLSAISGRVVLKQSVIDEITEELVTEYGLIMIDLVTEFPVIQATILLNYRSVTSKMVREIAQEQGSGK